MATYTGQPGAFEGQCEAARKSDGKRCTKRSIVGSNICQTHGAGAPQVKRAARERLAMLVDPALAKLRACVTAPKNDRHFTTQLQVAAARDILDRNGLKAKDEIIVHAEFDVGRFSHMSDDEIKSLVALARKASTLKDAQDAGSPAES